MVSGANSSGSSEEAGVEATPAEAHAGPPAGGWTALIDDIYEGRWLNPLTGETAPRAPYEAIVISDALDGAEEDLVARIGMTGRRVVVSDENTRDAMGARVARALGGAGGAAEEVVLDHPHADLETLERLSGRISGFEHVIAVGSGTINDLCKLATAQDGRKYCVFGTAASMDGYASTTASMTLKSGLKTSLKAQAAAGIFIDIAVNAAAPLRATASGFGDCLCRSVAQIDWWMSHRLLGTFYSELPYLISEQSEIDLNARAPALGRGDAEAVGYLSRALTLSGLGVNFTGVSNHGSMGEHQISHYIDCFAGDRHPGTQHGEQVGVATLTMARIQAWFLDQETPPKMRPTKIDPSGMARRMGAEIAAQCETEYRKKALDPDGAARVNERLAEIWPTLREECRALSVPLKEMEQMLRAAGGATSAAELGVSADFYREAVRHAHEMRNRFSFADIACDAGLLDDFAAAEG